MSIASVCPHAKLIEEYSFAFFFAKLRLNVFWLSRTHRAINRLLSHLSISYGAEAVGSVAIHFLTKQDPKSQVIDLRHPSISL